MWTRWPFQRVATGFPEEPAGHPPGHGTGSGSVEGLPIRLAVPERDGPVQRLPVRNVELQEPSSQPSLPAGQAARLRPGGPEPRTPPRRHRVDPERPPHPVGESRRQRWLAVNEVIFKTIPRVLQGFEGLVLNAPAGPPRPHQFDGIEVRDGQVRDPGAVPCPTVRANHPACQAVPRLIRPLLDGTVGEQRVCQPPEPPDYWLPGFSGNC